MNYDTNALNEQVQLQKQIQALEEIAKQYLDKDAISRYGTLKTAHPEKAVQVIALIAQAAQSGQIRGKITDAEFKEFLVRLEPAKKRFSITRK
jgi:programmed cell death protein 5